MFHIKNHKQQNIFDPWDYLGPKRRKDLESSWAELFQKEILSSLPVDSLRKHYHASNGRPTKELYSMLGVMILQQMHDMTDELAVEQFCFNIKWQYALNITNPGDAASYLSEKSLWTMRDKLTSDGIYTEIFETTLQRLITVFGVDLKKQRMDSVHIKSNMRHLGRIGLFVKTIKKFLLNLKRHHRDLFEQLDSNLTSRYLHKKEESIFAMVRPSESSRTLDQLAADILILTRRFASVAGVNDMSSYKLLTRLFQEQCLVEENEDESGEKAVARPNKDVHSDSLQNLSDPDAGYSSHKGKGYQAQVVENYSEEKNQLSLLTHVVVESADQHDANALLPALEQLQQKDMVPEKFLADSLYGSDSNCEQALETYDTEVIAPVMPGNQKKMQLADFTFDDGGQIVSCPDGVSPESVHKKKDSFIATFPIHTCSTCPRFKECPVTEGKKFYYYRYKQKDVRIALRRRHEHSDAFKDIYRFRAGVEATMSEFNRRTGVKHLRVRGMKAVAFAVIMKAVGLNILRTSRHKKHKTGSTCPPCAAFCSIEAAWYLVKKQLQRRIRVFCAISKNFWLKSTKVQDFAF